MVPCALISVTRAEPSLTIYNQNFAVVRDTLPLQLQAGANRIAFTDATMFLEPDSVILRDPSGQRTLQILEQNYRADPISEKRLLSLFEGQTIDFLTYNQNEAERKIVRGKIIRSGYVPGLADAYSNSERAQPIIEVNGVLRFSLPGAPLFPNLGSDTITKPSLNWLLHSDGAGPVQAELAYVTGQMTWKADYNAVAPAQSTLSSGAERPERNADDALDFTGWVTFNNQSGKSFENARIKLMAGDVSKIQPSNRGEYAMASRASGPVDRMGYPAIPPVTEKSFDEYHLYTLSRPATLRDRETKQVEFVRAQQVKSQRVYVYDGAKIDRDRYGSWPYSNIRQERDYGNQANPKVWVMREFINTKANGLGIPLPAGRVRFYRRDSDGSLEFTGENTIAHTPQGETLRLHTGSAFDLVGERRQTAYTIDNSKNFLDESFEIKLRNRKKEAVEIRIVEHLYRGPNWEISAKSNTLLKTDAQTIEFRVQVPPDSEKVVTYTVHYTW